MQFPNRDFRINTKSIQARGLVGWWQMYHPFNAGQNNHLVDLSLYSRKDPIVGRTLLTTTYHPSDIFGLTTKMNVRDTFQDAGYANLGHPPYLNVTTGPIAFSAWIKIDTGDDPGSAEQG